MKFVRHYDPRSEEPAGRRARLRCGTLARARGSKNLKTNPVRIFEENTAGLGSLGMRDHASIVDHRSKLLKPLLRLFHLFDGIDLERQMVQPGLISGERSVTLLP